MEKCAPSGMAAGSDRHHAVHRSPAILAAPAQPCGRAQAAALAGREDERERGRQRRSAEAPPIHAGAHYRSCARCGRIIASPLRQAMFSARSGGRSASHCRVQSACSAT